MQTQICKGCSLSWISWVLGENSLWSHGYMATRQLDQLTVHQPMSAFKESYLCYERIKSPLGNQSVLKYFAKLNFLCSNWPWDVRCRKVAGKRHLSNQYFILCSKYQWMAAIKASVLLRVRKYPSFKTFHLTFEVKVSITHSFPSFILSFGVPVLSKFTWREYLSWLTRASHAYLLFHQKIVNIEWTSFFSLEHSGCQLMWNGQKNQPEAFQFALLTQAG